MRFGILGTTAAWRDDGSEVAVGGPGLRALLALLLAHPGEVVTTHTLIDDLYGNRAPGELALAQGDHRVAFQRYEDTMRSYVDGCQKLADHLPFLADMPAKMARRTASAMMLPTYPD